MSQLLAHAMDWGLGLSVYLTAAFVGLLRLNPEIWLDDYPPDVRERYGPMSPKARRQRLYLGIPVLAAALALVVLGTVDFVRTGPSPVGFYDVALHTFVFLMVFNLVDLVLIDWLLFARDRPSWVVLPGTEGLEGYEDYGFHFRAFLKGTAGIAVASLVSGGIYILLG